MPEPVLDTAPDGRNWGIKSELDTATGRNERNARFGTGGVLLAMLDMADTC